MKSWIVKALFLSLSLIVTTLDSEARGRSSSGYSSYKPVSVRGYFRRDGTYVNPHFRSLPSRNYGVLPLPAISTLPPSEPPPVKRYEPAPAEPDKSSSPVSKSEIDDSQRFATPPREIPASPPLAPSRVATCPGKGWCYISVNADGSQDASYTPKQDLSYPPRSTLPAQRVIIVNYQ